MVSAKNSSLWAQIFGAVWIAVLFILKGLHIVDLDTYEIIASGFAIMGIFIPVYASIITDKLKGSK
jgi:hypothetical protein